MESIIVALDSMSIIILLTILFGASIDRTSKDTKARIFLMLTMVGIVGTLADAISFIMVGSERNEQVVGILNCVTLICAVLFGICYTNYIIAYVKEKKTISRAYTSISIVWGILVIIGIVAGYISGAYFYMEDGEYHTGKYYYVCLGSIMLIILYSAFLVISFIKEIEKRNALALLIYVLAPLTTSLIEIVIPGLALSYVGLAFATLVLYVFIQSVEINTSRISEEAARQIIKEKSDFIAKFSHELRSPINAVIGLDEMIIRSTEDDEILNCAGGIQSASKTLLGIINDILDSSKLEAGKIELIETEYDILTVINDLVNIVSVRMESKNIHFKLDVDKELPRRLYGDDVKLKQIVTNLLTNAVKYTKEGSVNLAITFSGKAEDEIELKISVRDTGIGIRKEDLEKLFKPFERIDEIRNRNVEGTGLGMFITQGFLRIMDSELEVESEYGKGSNFSFTVTQRVADWSPIGEFDEAVREMNREKHVYKPLFKAPEAKVLVVDDTRINLIVCQKLLKNTLVKCALAISGDKAVELCKDNEYDIILMDQMMPGIDGTEAMRIIRNDEASLNRNTPIVVLTANATAGDREKYIGLGFDDYISKPIDYMCLEQTLLRLLPKEKIT